MVSAAISPGDVTERTELKQSTVEQQELCNHKSNHRTSTMQPRKPSRLALQSRTENTPSPPPRKVHCISLDVVRYQKEAVFESACCVISVLGISSFCDGSIFWSWIFGVWIGLARWVWDWNEVESW